MAFIENLVSFLGKKRFRSGSLVVVHVTGGNRPLDVTELNIQTPPKNFIHKMFSLELFHVQTFKEETTPPTCPQLPNLLKIKGSITSHSNIQILAPRDSPQWPGRAAPHNRSGAPYRSAGNRSVAARR